MRKLILGFAAASALALSACGTAAPTTPAPTLEQQRVDFGEDLKVLCYNIAVSADNPFIETEKIETDKSKAQPPKPKKKWNPKTRKFETVTPTPTPTRKTGNGATTETEIEAKFQLAGCDWEADRKPGTTAGETVSGRHVEQFAVELEATIAGVEYEVDFPDNIEVHTPADAIALVKDAITTLPASERPPCFKP